MRFGEAPPNVAERMSPQEMRDVMNLELKETGVVVSGAQFTRAGNIALTPMAPHGVSDLLGQAAGS